MSRAKDVRRRAIRFPIRLEGSLSGRLARSATVVDLSLTGCLIRCDALLDHGAILDLALVLGGEPFATKVRVTEAYLDGACAPEDTSRYLTGLEFLALPALEETRLRRFLEQERQRRRSGASP